MFVIQYEDGAYEGAGGSGFPVRLLAEAHKFNTIEEALGHASYLSFNPRVKNYLPPPVTTCESCDKPDVETFWQAEWELHECSHCFYWSVYEDNFNDDGDWEHLE